MATIYPDTPTDFNDSQGEEAVFYALRNLEDRFIVFHSLRWLDRQRRGPHEALEGEADFLIIDPDRGLLVIEVKGGGIRIANAQWFQTNLHTLEEIQMQDPAAQASRSSHYLRKLLTSNPGIGISLRVFSAVWFPAQPFAGDRLPLNCPPEIVLDAESLHSVRESIDGVFEFWTKQLGHSKLGQVRLRNVVETLAPEYGVMPSFRSGMESRNRRFVRLTSEQARVFDYLEEQPSAVIAGPAGSGKTLLALEIARRISASGHDVTYLCYNSALRLYLKSTHPIERVSFHTFHSFAAAAIGRSDLNFPELERALMDDLCSGGTKLTNLVIDEGQDFPTEWLEALVKAAEAKLFIFYDRNQLLYSSELPRWIQDSDCRLVLRRICRNTQQIARTVSRVIGALAGACDQLPIGSKPMLHVASTLVARNEILRSLLLTKVNEQEIRPGEIAILCPQPDDLCSSEALSAFPLSQEYSDSAVCVTTIRKFKGLEAPIVVLTDVDLSRLGDLEFRRLLYVGCSRGVHELHILLKDASTEALRAAVGAIGDGTPMALNLRSLCFLLAAAARIG